MQGRDDKWKKMTIKEKLKENIDHFMEKNKDERPQNGDEAFEFLNNLEQGCLPDISSGSESDSDEIDTDGANPRRRRTRRRRR